MNFELYYQTSGVCTDTRNIQPDCLFICLKGANFNGNEFAKKALEEGAKFVVVDEPEFATNERIFLVENSLTFLQHLAEHHRFKFSIPIIGITGSNGKTSSKELINSVLSQKFNVLATIGNLNNHIGVPLTLLRLNETHEIAIIEMGANKFGDIKELCEIAHPTHGIITNIGKAHLEGFKNFEGVLKTKKELYDSVSMSNGIIVYNGDDQLLKNNLPTNIQTISYGKSSNCDLQGNLDKLTPFISMSWSHLNYRSPILETKMIGEYNFYNYLAAITFGIQFGLSPDEINHGVTSYIPTNNRSQVKETATSTLILDCYNANPSSMKSALESFSQIDHPKKYFIIGDMLELGEEAQKEHSNIAELIQKLDLKGFSVGPLFKSLQSTSFIEQFESTNDAKHYFENQTFNDTLILLKGSRGIGLEVLEHSF